MLVLYFNLFSWHVHSGPILIIIILVIILSMIGCLVLAKRTIGKVEIWFSLLVSIGLAVFGVGVLYEFYSETISSGIFSRSVLSPHWFRLTIFVVYLTSIISWLIYPYKTLKNSNSHAKI